MTADSDRRFMSLALALGRRAQGRVAPRPPVGCVLVRNGRIVGRGWTQETPPRHAERVALDQAGEGARGATAYVTLEPCAHHGRTPPCSEALIAAGVARVVASITDPDPRVAGQGFAKLHAAGIRVDTGLGAEEARDDLAGFLSVQERGRPFVTLKLAASLDGRIATATGESQWITGPEARRQVHALRARCDAVLVGAGTAREDDPTLTVRGLGIGWQPARVVFSRRLDIPRPGNLGRTIPGAPLYLCHGPEAPEADRQAWQALGATLVPCPSEGRQIDPHAALEALARAGLTRIFCEGGGSLAASLLYADLVDELACFSAGLALGAEGLPMIGALGVDRLAEAPRFQLAECRPVGADILHRWTRR